MGDKKKPHITIILVAIAVLSINQLAHQYQCQQNNQILWEHMIQQAEILKEHQESLNQYQEKKNHYLEELNRILDSVYK